MNKEELTMISFEIVSYAGDARSKLLLALEKAKQGLFEECDDRKQTFFDRSKWYSLYSAITGQNIL